MKKFDKRGNKKRSILVIAVVVLTIGVLFSWNGVKVKYEEKEYPVFLQEVEDGKVDSILYDKNGSYLLYHLENGDVYQTANPDYDDFKKEMLEKGVEVEEKEKINVDIYLSLLMNTVYVVVFVMLIKTFTKKEKFVSEERLIKPNVTFKDVAGLEEVKEDISIIADMLSNPKKYKKAGAKLPKGVLFYGSPGTGKTLLAKAIAGEARANFISVSASDFSNKFVGVGGDRVRSLFSYARQHTPCIIFIDEIDAVGAQRGAVIGENRNTLNTLLSEMDGFKEGEGIVVIAATNRLEDLDSALIRPGRFDNHFAIPIPTTSRERREIIDIYIKDKQLSDDVDLDALAKETMGCSPADIEVIINESAIISSKRDGVICRSDIDEAILKKLLKGHQKKSFERKEEESRIVAWHEAGHALANILLDKEVTKVSIIPTTSGAGGVTFNNNEKMGMYSKKELEDRLKVLYAGRVAEHLLNGEEEVTTGASQDISVASDIIKQMICLYGMSGYGLINLNKFSSNEELIIEEAKAIANTQYEIILGMLKDNVNTLQEIANLLLEKETIYSSDIKEIVDRNR